MRMPVSPCRPFRAHGGFTLIELMVAVAVVAILVALAVPAYTDYTVRSKVTECISGASVAKVQVSEFRQSRGMWPPTADEAGIASPAGVSHYCQGFTAYSAASGAFSIDVDESEVNPGISGIIQPTLTPQETPSAIMF